MRIENSSLKSKIIEQLGNKVFKEKSISNEDIKKIKTLTIDTSLDDIQSKDIELLPQLEELLLIGNDIKKYRLNKLRKLNTLKIRVKTIDDIPDLKKIKKLNDLSIELDSNENSDKYLNEIEKLKNLNYLTLINFNVQSLYFLKNLKELYKLKILNSIKYEIKDMKVLSDLYLESIFFENMIIHNEDIKYMNTDAKELVLINCGINSLEEFKKFKRLKLLDLENNELTDSSFQDLKKLVMLNPKITMNLGNNNITNNNILKGLNKTELEVITCNIDPTLYSVEDFNYNVNLSSNLKYNLYLDSSEFMKLQFVEKSLDRINKITIDLKDTCLEDSVLDYILNLENVELILKLNDFTKINTKQLKIIRKYKKNLKINITENKLRIQELYNIEEFIEMYIKLCDIVNNAPQKLNDIEKVCFAYLYIGNNYKKAIVNKKHNKRNNNNLYSLFIENKGYEDGIADVMKLLLTAFNLKVVTVEAKSETGDIKTWNKVKLFNSWYNMDLESDLIELEKGNVLKYFLRGELDFNHTKYITDNNIKCADNGIDMNTLINQLYLMNKKINEKEKISV